MSNVLNGIEPYLSKVISIRPLNKRAISRRFISTFEIHLDKMEEKKTRRAAQKGGQRKKLKVSKNKLESESDHAEKSVYFDGSNIVNGEKAFLEKDIEDVMDQLDTWKPENWKIMLENIKEMRKNKDAPVDSMGCDKCYDENVEPEVRRFQALVALMLSSQTKDEVTFAAMERLKNCRSGLKIESILEMTETEIEGLIYPVGFYKRKAKYIKEAARILKDKFNGDIPNNVELLCTLPGVGQKMAHICMKSAWGVISGIGVDTHVHRISNRIGWVKKPTKTPEQTRVALETWLPKPLWEEVNHLLVGFGQTTCKPIKPLCEICLNKLICPFSKSL